MFLYLEINLPSSIFDMKLVTVGDVIGETFIEVGPVWEMSGVKGELLGRMN